MDRSSKQKIKKDMLELNQSLDQIEWRDMYRTFRPMKPAYTLSQVYIKPPPWTDVTGKTQASLSRCRCCGCCKSLSCVWLFATPWTVAHQDPVSMRFPRQESCSGLSFPSPGHLPDLLQEGGPLPGPESGLLSNTRKWIVRGDTCADEGRDYIGKGRRVESRT